MKEIIRELGNLLVGEITAEAGTREFFSTDGSVFKVEPSLVIYPRNESDVVITVKYLRNKAENGEYLPITARGKGTDQGGGALGTGALMVFPAHMKRLIHIDKESVTVQPGMIYSHLEGILHSHGRFLPPYPASVDFATIGGAIANNSAGEKTVKYGSTRDYVGALRVVLSNGDVISTYRMSKRELEKKKMQDDFEGHIYRAVDQLIESNKALIHQAPPHVSKNSAGYDLWDVKRKNGSFDLSQLIVGSQGTLGVVTEATLLHEALNPQTTLLVGFFDSIEKATEAVERIMSLNPSALEVVDYHLLDFLRTHKPEQIEGLVPEQLPQIALLIEFDDQKARHQAKKARKVAKLFKKLAYDSRFATDPDEQDALWKIRRGAAAVIWMINGPKKALPIIEDGVVPLHKMPEFLESVYALFRKYKLDIAVWGHAGDANFHLQPFMDLSNMRDRGKVFDLMDDFYKLVIRMGGSTCGEHNDGRLRAPYLKKLYGADMYRIFEQVKQIFDPANILNPGVKIGVTQEDAAVHLRREYSMKHLHDFLPGVMRK
ncbi:FAD-binding oxidoreductase [bacterium]|nr:FAD-binding oxidoreductase [bacterium]